MSGAPGTVLISGNICLSCPELHRKGPRISLRQSRLFSNRSAERKQAGWVTTSGRTTWPTSRSGMPI